MNKDSFKTDIGQSIGYDGLVTVSIEDGDRVYRKKRFHNEGKTKLFKFFADCLTGNYSGAEQSRPCRIVLFGGEDDKPNVNDRLSSFVYYDAAPNIEENSEYSSVSYHFRLPYLALKTGKKIYACGLYPAMGNKDTDMCAFFEFKKPEALPSTDSNLTVIIDWKMTISNQKKESNANASSNNASSADNTSSSDNSSAGNN